MTPVLCTLALIWSVPVIVAARSYHAFILEEAGADLARRWLRLVLRIGEPANDNGGGTA